MTPTSILADNLRSIPPRLRFWMLLIFSIIVAVVTLLQVWDVELPYDKIHTTLVIVGGYLGVQSAANVKKEA